MKALKLLQILLFCSLYLYGGNTSLDLTKKVTSENEQNYKDYILNKPSSEDSFVALQRIIEQNISEKNWAKAVKKLEEYQQLLPNFENRILKIIELLKSEDNFVEVSEIIGEINSNADEYSPIITKDGKTLFFTAFNRINGKGKEDIWFSNLQNGNWQKPEPLNNSINTKANESITGVSDQGTIHFFGNYTNNFGKGDIYYSIKNNNEYEDILHFPKPINSEYFESDCFVFNDSIMFFVSDRSNNSGSFHQIGVLFHGSYWGNSDIYICEKTKNGWSNPQNIGEKINTPFAERKPFLSSDGKTLYFASEGHYGMGRLDIFKSERLNDSWTNWSEPTNLGKTVNSPADDWGYITDEINDLAYFSSDRSEISLGKGDIYSAKYSEPQSQLEPLEPLEQLQNEVVEITGVIENSAGKPLVAEIKWKNVETDELEGKTKSDSVSGEYRIVLPIGDYYHIFAVKEGFFLFSKYLDLRQQVETFNITENMELLTFDELKEQKQAVRINNIFFETNSAKLSQISHSELNAVMEVLEYTSDLQIEVSGHTDSQGSDEFNLKLSEDRAVSVVSYLIFKGFKSENIEAKGFGETKPLVPNDTEDGRKLNRRVEIKFLNE